MPDVNIGALPNLADVQDDALLAVEFEGKAYHLNGAQWKAFARQAVSAYSEAAAKSATDAAAAQTAAEQAKTTAETAAKSAAENASATQTAKDTAVSAANRAQGYTNNPPKPSEDGTVWMLWDGTQYVTTDIPARSELLPKIWMADFDTHGMVGEVILLSSLSGPEEATLESVNSGDFLISTKDGGILRISGLFESFWGQPDTPCAGMDPVIYGYLPKYPATLTVGFSQGCDFVCDGVDDQVEIMAALNALPPLGGKIRFEGGTYNLSGSIKPNSGIGDVEMYCDINNRARIVGNYAGGIWRGMFYLREVGRLTVRNLIMENASTASFGLEVEGLSRGGCVENVSFVNINEPLTADDVLGIGVLEAKNCRFTGADVAVHGAFIRVLNCCFADCLTGVQFRSHGAESVVQNCVFTNVNAAVYVQQQNAVISGNVMQTTDSPFYLAADMGALVAGNTFVGVNVTETNGNTFVGNTFKEE